MDNASLSILKHALKLPGMAGQIHGLIDEMPEVQRNQLLKRLREMPTLPISEIATGKNGNGAFISADLILNTQWEEPLWIVPDMIPAGLTFLAGAPKMGKSWLSLQLSQAVASGGIFLGKRCPQGNACYLALEDSPRRLKNRMIKQLWVQGLPVEFMTVGKFDEQIGDLRKDGIAKLRAYIEQHAFTLVIIDTFSRAINADQNDVAEVTEWLKPVQETAQELNCAILVIDHFKKLQSNSTKDGVDDILGSRAKGAMADTIISLYRERGNPSGKLVFTGREIEDFTLEIRMDRLTGCWQLDNNPLSGLTAEQADMLLTLESITPATMHQICDAMGKDYEKSKGAFTNRLNSLASKGKIYRLGDKWAIVEADNGQL